MKKYIITGGKQLEGEVTISGSKNVVSKAIVAACLTSDEVTIKNIPLISDLYVPLDVVKELGGTVRLTDHSIKIRLEHIKNTKISLEAGASRTSSLFIAPLLARAKEALVPNPGGCRLGARPIDRHVEGLEKMGATVKYYSDDGYFHAKTDGLTGATYTFEKNTHTGTETLILAAVLAKGRTVLHNAAEEPEVDDLIVLLTHMGAKIKRDGERTIIIDGVEKLHGTSHTIMFDRNEAVTFAIVSSLTGGNLRIKNIDLGQLRAILEKFKEAGGEWEEKNSSIRFFLPKEARAVEVTTAPHPGFMTDWQGPWSILMTQAEGESLIHETIYENRFSYVKELRKMGARLRLFDPKVENPSDFYNFNYESALEGKYRQALKIVGPTKLHNAVLTIQDLRAGATLVLASLIAKGKSVIYGVEHIERGYEAFDARLKKLGADIESVGEHVID